MAVLTLSTGIRVTIEINGQPGKFENNFLKEFIAHSGIGYSIPGATLKVLDLDGSFSNGDQNLVDGTHVYMEVTRGTETEPKVFDMRVLGKVKSEPSPGGTLRTATLVPNLPNFLIEAQREYYEGTSTQVIKEILSQHNVDLKTGEGYSPQDSMCWINIGKTQAQFFRDILIHSYNGESSCVHGALDWDTYHLDDLFNCLEREPQVGFFNIQSVKEFGKNVRLDEAEPDSVNGLMNALSGYGHTHVQHSLSGEDFVFDQAAPKSFGSGLPVSSDVHNAIDLTSLTGGSWFDSGTNIGANNMHENYYQAKYLNTRHLGLFTESVRCITEDAQSLPLFSTVHLDYCEMGPSGAELNKAYSGTYLVGTKTYVVRDTNYAEVYQLIRSFIEQPGTTPLVDSQNVSSVVPKTTPSVPTAVDPADPNRESLAAKTPNPNVKGAVVQQESEQKELARELGELDPDQDPEKALDKPGVKPETLEKNALDSFVDRANKQVEELFSGWAEQGQAFASKHIVDKYGKGRDYLKAAGSEFQSALKKLDDLCSELIPSELDSLSLIGPDIGAVIGMLASRVNDADRIQAELLRDLNQLVANGDIPASYVENPRLKSKCKALREEVLNKINSKANEADLPTKCLDKFDMARLSGAQNKLGMELRQLEALIDDLVCADGGNSSGIEVGENKVL